MKVETSHINVQRRGKTVCGFYLKKTFFLFLMEKFADFMELIHLEFVLSMSNFLLRLKKQKDLVSLLFSGAFCQNLGSGLDWLG